MRPAIKQAIMATPDELASHISDQVVAINETLFNFKVALATQLIKQERQFIWSIFVSNMRQFYANSSFGWDPPSKKRELFHRLGRFIIVRSGEGFEGSVVAFATFRFEHEEEHNVVYCYEVQIAEPFRRYGLGKLLMQCLWDIGQHQGLDKVLLTVFKGLANEAAVQFYEKIGFSVDPTSPGYTSPSNTWVDEDEEDYDYQIMSKLITTSDNATPSEK